MKKIIILITFLIILAGISCLNIYTHEQVHKEIMLIHGCNETEIKYFNLNFRATTECKSYYYERPDSVILQELELHSINEIVSYNINTILVVLILAVLIFSAIFIGLMFKSE